MRAVVPGSFDPVTWGHLDVVSRAARIFDEVVVAVGVNSSKSYLFDTDERVSLLRAAVADLPGVTVEPLDGLLVDFCAARGAEAVVKGARSGSDFDFEVGMARMNHALTGLETVILPAAAQWGHVSSTLVRQVATLGGDVTGFVPPVVVEALAGRTRR